MIGAALLGLGTMPASATQVPFVGCTGSGQAGVEHAPRSGAVPRVPAAVAGQLAYYSSSGFGVLAPRGWHCFATSGSSGGSLIVSERPLNTHSLDSLFGLRARAVVISFSYGGTSGRFAVARAVHRMFPAYGAFARNVAAERGGIARLEPPSPHDRITRRSRTVADFITPAGRDGVGTASRLAASPEPIQGTAILLPDQEMNLVQISLRLGQARRAETEAILAHFRATRGSPPPR